VSLPFREETYSVAQLCGEIRDLLGTAYDSVWVAGEINRLRQSQRGHVYFELVEKGSGDEIVGKLEAVAWQRDHSRIRRILAETDQELTEGMEIRCRGGVDFYGPFGRLQFVVREVDPIFTLGNLARRRKETLSALSAAGLLEKNKRLELSALPLRVALITSEGSAAYHDFLSTLRESGFGFQVLLLHASVQGREAERELTSALSLVQPDDVDCVVLIRGGGSRADLAVFDSRALTEAVARTPVPVLTGLGHQTDLAIADVVAHTSLKTPTKVAEFLVERLRGAELDLRELRSRLASGALGPVRLATLALDRARQRLGASGLRLAAASRRLDAVRLRLEGTSGRILDRAGLVVGLAAGRLGRAGPRCVGRRAGEPERLGRRIVGASGHRLRGSGFLDDPRPPRKAAAGSRFGESRR